MDHIEHNESDDAKIVEAKNVASKDNTDSNANKGTEMPEKKPLVDVGGTDKAKGEEPLPNTTGPASSTNVTNTPAARKPALSTGPFRYDQGAAQLVVGRRRIIPILLRHLPLFNQLFAKDGVANCRRGYVSYIEMGMLHKEGWIDEHLPTCSALEKADLLANHRAKVEARPEYYAQACARDLYRRLRKHNVEPEAFLRCDRKSQTYCLGDGWATRRPLINAPTGYLVHRKDLDRESQRSIANTENEEETDAMDKEEKTEEDEDDSMYGYTRDEEAGGKTD